MSYCISLTQSAEHELSIYIAAGISLFWCIKVAARLDRSTNERDAKGEPVIKARPAARDPNCASPPKRNSHLWDRARPPPHRARTRAASTNNRENYRWCLDLCSVVIHENERQQYIPASAHTAAQSEVHARSEFKGKYKPTSAESHLWRRALAF